MIVLVFGLAACQPATPAVAPIAKHAERTPLKFTYWGSVMEKAAIEDLVSALEARKPDVAVPINAAADWVTLSATACGFCRAWTFHSTHTVTGSLSITPPSGRIATARKVCCPAVSGHQVV